MGYTHYWYRPLAFDAAPFALFVEEVRTLIQRLPTHSLSAGGYYEEYLLTIRGPHGEGEPIITDELVSFNGDGCGQDMSHETFYVPRVMEPQSWQQLDPLESNNHFECCKTARKPYDLLVCACLIALKYHFPQITVRSDGSTEDWFIPLMWYIDVFDHKVPIGPWTPVSIEQS